MNNIDRFRIFFKCSYSFTTYVEVINDCFYLNIDYRVYQYCTYGYLSCIYLHVEVDDFYFILMSEMKMILI